MTYEQALSAIHEIPWKSKKPGLDRITELMHLMGDPQENPKVLSHHDIIYMYIFFFS